MLRVWIGTLLLVMLVIPTGLAHVENEKTLYDDIETSKALEDIVYLRGMGLIAAEAGAKLYRPLAPLRKADLAYWAGMYHGFGAEGKSPEQVREEAMRRGLVDALEGDATYADVSRAYAEGKASAPDPDAKLTREAFASYMRRLVQDPAEGKALAERIGYKAGPSGVIEQVIEGKEGEGSSAYSTYKIVVGGQEYVLSQHPKALFGPTDLKQWQGKTLEETWLSGAEAGKPELQILKLAKGQFSSEAIAASSGGHEHHGEHGEHADGHEEAKRIPYLPIAAVLLGAAVVLWLRRKPATPREES
ncbi:hypothetical protein [Paenibacillus puerhi]|uniref:hypothetical protein n=1 Tax=Paenibacillus puerhi TaxID=2692622 RepID=UPI001359220E|nr:hypothetical protein [Paenibacillus puerhi]